MLFFCGTVKLPNQRDRDDRRDGDGLPDRAEHRAKAFRLAHRAHVFHIHRTSQALGSADFPAPRSKGYAQFRPVSSGKNVVFA